MDNSSDTLSVIAEIFAREYGESPNYVRGFLQQVLSRLQGREITQQEGKVLIRALRDHFVTRAVRRGLVEIGLTVGISPEQTEAYFELPDVPGRDSNAKLFVDQACRNISRGKK